MDERPEEASEVALEQGVQMMTGAEILGASVNYRSAR